MEEQKLQAHGSPSLGSVAEKALCEILRICCTEIDAHLSTVLDRDDATGPHKARVWLRRTVTALDAFGPILRRRAKAALRAQAKAIFRELGRLRDRDVLVARLAEGARTAQLIAATSKLREKVRARLRERNAVLFSPLLLRMVEDGSLWRRGATARELRSGPVEPVAVSALNHIWATCVKRKSGFAKIAPAALHGFRKDLKTLRYLSEFFMPFLDLEPIAAGRAARFRGDMQRMQDLLGVVTDAELAKAMGKKAWARVDNAAVRAAVDQAEAVWQTVSQSPPWWRTGQSRASFH